MVQVDQKSIESIAGKNQTAAQFFEYAANRTRAAREGISSIKGIRELMLKDGYAPIPKDLRQLFRDLELVGIGRLSGDTFKWDISMVDLAQEVIKPTPPKIEPLVTPRSLPSATKTLVIPFDTNKEIRVTFTPNLTNDEISYLAKCLLKECE